MSTCIKSARHQKNHSIYLYLFIRKQVYSPAAAKHNIPFLVLSAPPLLIQPNEIFITLLQRAPFSNPGHIAFLIK